ncbi:MAG: hypothetical protein QOG09_1807 [Solirubrobacterales bacterium]|jgi:hypothetical protein|nr:hypothetical protein [Solirubrobacterales bacterium]
MESPARLYASLVGAVLTIAGIAGFFYSSDFGSPGATSDVLGLLTVNGWHNVVHIATGALGLLAMGYAARAYAGGLGVVYLGVAIWGFAIGSGENILGFLPVNTADNFLHLALGVLGIAAYLATPAEAEARAPAPS